MLQQPCLPHARTAGEPHTDNTRTRKEDCRIWRRWVIRGPAQHTVKNPFYLNEIILFTKTLKPSDQFFSPRATRKVSDDLPRDAFGLRSTTR